MGSTIIHQGMKIGHLEVLEELENNKYRCKCDCGTECVRSFITLYSAVRYNKDLYCSYGCTSKYSKYIGLRSGHLEVIQVLDKVVDEKYLCKCRCDCGNIVEKPLTLVRCKQVQSCSTGCTCSKKYKDMSDIIGKRFGNLVVLEYSHKKDRHIYYYVCKCDCGNILLARRDYLLNGTVASCGCLRYNKKLKNWITYIKNPEDKNKKVKRMNTVVYVGREVGHLTILEKQGNKYRCRCACGNECFKPYITLYKAIESKSDIYCSRDCSAKANKEE